MQSLVKYEAAKKALAEALRVDEVKSIRDQAVALQHYAAQAKDREMIDRATEIRLRAERRAGELLRITGENGERAMNRPKKGLQPATLSEMGVSKTQSSRWQALAAMPEAKFEERVEHAKRRAISIVDGTSQRTRAEMRAEDEERVALLRPIPGKFHTLVIDPPWEFDWLSETARGMVGYATMPHDKLMELDVAQWADDRFCHLYLWTTNNFIGKAHDLSLIWGFEHKTVLTWVKPKFGLGTYFRNQTEHVLFATRGPNDLCRTRRDDVSNVFEAPLGEHSEKPERFYEIVRSMSHGPYGEIFQRAPRPDFQNLFAPAEPALAAE